MKTKIYYLISFAFIVLLSVFNISAQQTKTNHQLDSLITVYLAEVNPDSLESYIQSLQDFGSRYAYNPNHKEVAEWIKNKFTSFGFTNAKLDSLTVVEYFWNDSIQDYDSAITWQYNVVSTLEGTTKPKEYFIIGAHHDSYRRTWDTLPPVDEGGPAPGADDDASGVAGVLEIARIMVMKNYQPDYSIQFVTFAIEEVGMDGSKSFVDSAVASNMNIKFMINLDMIAYEPDTVADSVALAAPTNSEWLRAIADTIRQKHTTLVPIYENYAPGDAVKFWDAGYVALYLHESFHTFNPNYHRITDVVANCNMDYCAQVVRIAFGTLLYANDIIIGINERISNASTINIYPSPTNGIVNIVINNNRASEHINIEITNLNGQVIYSKQFSNNTQQRIDLTNQPKGMYFVKIKNNNFVKTEKLIIY